LTLEVYQPPADFPQSPPRPTVVVIYGGAWQRGTPTQDPQLSRYLAAQGYVVVAVDYRHAPQYRFPAQLEDVERAIAFVCDHAAEYEVDCDRMAVLGRSAGAHLAMLAAYRSSSVPLRAVVNYYGPVDLASAYRNPPVPDPIDTRGVLNAFLGAGPDQVPELYRQASPLAAVQPQLPPTLMFYGGRDNVVEAKYGRELAQQLQATGNSVVYIEIPWADHSFDAVFNGVSNQLAVYYIERFLAHVLR
ncbi:MAG TPA: alpha/beta hydrolase, partial [Trichocoleus sp.]